MSDSPLLEISELTKSYSGVTVLDHVSFSVSSGMVLGLIGENGAGKSTLIKCVNGVTAPDSGTLKFDGRDYLPSISAALKNGIITIPQEFNLAGTLTGREDTTADLNRELQAATDRDIWGPFFVGLYPLISLTASDLRATGDKIKNAVKEPILKAVSALCDAVDEKPTEEPPKAEEPPETTPEEPETVPEPEPEGKPEEPAKSTQKKNNHYYRPFPLTPAPPIWRF